MKADTNRLHVFNRVKAALTVNISVVVLMLGLVCSSSKLSAQDIHFSQVWMTPLLQNPAMAGVNHDLAAILNFKDQWSTVASPYRTYNFSFDMRLNKKKAKKGFLAAGINAFSDKAGDAQMATNYVNLNLAYHVFLNANNKLGGAVSGGFGQRSINVSQLQWMNQYNGMAYDASLASGEPTANTKVMYPDVGAGLVWSYEKPQGTMSSNDQLKSTLGVSLSHLNQPKYSFYGGNEKLDMKIAINGSLLYGFKNSNFSLVPSFAYYIQGTSQELIIGSMFRYTLQQSSKYTGNMQGSAVSVGVHTRAKDALIASTLIEKGQFALGLSYDINLSPLTKASQGRGGFEISLRFVTPNPFYTSATRVPSL